MKMDYRYLSQTQGTTTDMAIIPGDLTEVMTLRPHRTMDRMRNGAIPIEWFIP